MFRHNPCFVLAGGRAHRRHGARSPQLVLVALLVAGLAPPVAGLAPPVAARLCVNEVLYDAAGADGGYEFVEIYNASDSTHSLAGYRLEAGDGAGPARWRVLWEGGPGEVLPPRARLTIGEASVYPPPDRVRPLGLENGPDGVRLVAPDGSDDRVGWGSLTYNEYFEGQPAPDVPAGYSLARSPDGHDTGDNAANFVAASPPTPGGANRPEADVLLSPLAVSVSAPRIRLGEIVEARAAAVNGGLTTLDAGEMRWGLWVAARSPHPLPGAESEGVGISPDSLVVSGAAVDPVAPGDTIPLALAWAPIAEGAFRLRIKVQVSEDGVLGNDLADAPLRVGRGPLEITEVHYAPASGEAEWVEIRCRDGVPVDLSRFRLRDAAGTEARLTPGVPAFAEPESLILLTADAAGWLALHPDADPARVFTFQPWPRLNNETGADGVADRVVLVDERGVLSDQMSYEGGDADGHSLERRDLEAPAEDEWNWGRSALPGGTPLAPNSARPGAGAVGSLELSTATWQPAAAPGGVTVSYRLAWPSADVDLRVVDLRGRKRRQLARGPSGAFATVDWNGEDDAGKRLPSGPYLVALEARPLDGEGHLRLLRPLVVEP